MHDGLSAGATILMAIAHDIWVPPKFMRPRRTMSDLGPTVARSPFQPALAARVMVRDQFHCC
jgi:hypothetical protein